MEGKTITRQSLIYDFMTQTSRPVSELAMFLSAFEASEPTRPAKATRIPPRMTIHNGKTVNVHPRSVMIEVTRGDETIYYGSITAAASALGVTGAAIQYALKHGTEVNGQTLKRKNKEDIFKP